MAQLRTDYKDEILDASVNTQRKYRQVDNEDGTISFVDVTEYSQQGDPFGAGDINAITGNLTADNGESFNFAYNSETNEYGYMAKVEGADTFCPFKSGIDISNIEVLNSTSGTSLARGSITKVAKLTLSKGKYILCANGEAVTGAGAYTSDYYLNLTVGGTDVGTELFKYLIDMPNTYGQSNRAVTKYHICEIQEDNTEVLATFYSNTYFDYEIGGAVGLLAFKLA